MELGTTYCYKRSGMKRSLVEKKETFQYIPLLDNLEWILQNKDIHNEVAKYLAALFSYVAILFLIIIIGIQETQSQSKSIAL